MSTYMMPQIGEVNKQENETVQLAITELHCEQSPQLPDLPFVEVLYCQQHPPTEDELKLLNLD
ncbi:hypothetical protein PV-S19_0429 [Pacmanvirus S19]|nr:hypothetical protein PV-S19_0429 [Pacmanvirus S19]